MAQIANVMDTTGTDLTEPVDAQESLSFHISKQCSFNTTRWI
jgi:hypothetical protein